MTRAEEILLKEMRYIVSISNGQVKRVADSALASVSEYLATEPSGERAELIERQRWVHEHGANPAMRALAKATVSMLEADAQQAKRVPMTAAERSSAWIAATIEMPSHENCYLRGMFDAEAHHGITQADKPTGWDNGLSQDYCAEFGQWLASRPGARQQIKEMFERDTW